MKFKLDRGYEAAEVAAGIGIFRVDEESPEISTWDVDGVTAMLGRPGFKVVEESVADVVAQIEKDGDEALSDRELKAVILFDQRDGVQKTALAEQERRHQAAIEAMEAFVAADSAERRRAEREQLLARLQELDELDEQAEDEEGPE